MPSQKTRGHAWRSTLCGLTVLAASAIATPAQAALDVGSTITLSSQGIGLAPPMKVMLRMADTNELIYQSGQTGRFIPRQGGLTASSSTPADPVGAQLNLGVGQAQQLNIISSSKSLGGAYADSNTRIQSLPLDAFGNINQAVPNFIENVWVSNASGQRVPVSFSLSSGSFNSKTGYGEISGAFVEADGTTTQAKGSFSVVNDDGCGCNYIMRLTVDRPPVAVVKDLTPIPGPLALTPGGGSSLIPFIPLGALGLVARLISSPRGASPTPAQPVPTPAVLPGLIGCLWQTRRRWKRQQAKHSAASGAVQ